MKLEDWIRDFGEPGSHIPYNVVPSSFAQFNGIEHMDLRNSMEDRCESPIEVELGIAFAIMAKGRFVIEPQHPMGHYRFDFLITDVIGHPIVLVECDGKEFHSSAQQLANDHRKDVFAASKGLKVIRVSGADIFQSPNHEAALILDFCLRKVWA